MMDKMPTFTARRAPNVPRRAGLRSDKVATPEPTPAPSPVKDALKVVPGKKPRSSVGRGRGQPRRSSPPNSDHAVSRAKLEADGDLRVDVEARLGALSLNHTSSTEELAEGNLGGIVHKRIVDDKDNSRPLVEVERPAASNAQAAIPKTDGLPPPNPPLMIKIKIPKASKVEGKSDDELKSKEGRS